MTDPRIAILTPFFQDACRQGYAEAIHATGSTNVGHLVQAALAALDAAKPQERPKPLIVPVERPQPQGLTGRSAVKGVVKGLTAAQINQTLGFRSNTAKDDEKRYSWGFSVNGRDCLLYDWHASYIAKEFTAVGPAEAFTEVFGDSYQSE